MIAMMICIHANRASHAKSAEKKARNFRFARSRITTPQQGDLPLATSDICVARIVLLEFCSDLLATNVKTYKLGLNTRLVLIPGEIGSNNKQCMFWWPQNMQKHRADKNAINHKQQAKESKFRFKIQWTHKIGHPSLVVATNTTNCGC